jgi:hypothetical protein
MLFTNYFISFFETRKKAFLHSLPLNIVGILSCKLLRTGQLRNLTATFGKANTQVVNVFAQAI